jgi:GT2 family glycosyltransferase
MGGAENFSQIDILLVDSASTDRTVEIAKQYPIDIVRLNPDWFLSASAGRYIGTYYTQGELIMYLDGDMELAPEWLDVAVPYLLEHSDVAGVTGYFRNVDRRDGQIIGEEFLYRNPHGRIIEAKFFGGAALYRRSALEEVGGFNPYLISYEEPELGMRLRYAGYKLMCLPSLVCTHYGLMTNSWEYCIRRLRSRLWLGMGQVLRYHLRSGLFQMFPRELYLQTLVYLGGGLVSMFIIVLALLLRNVQFLIGWALVVSLIVIVFWIKKRDMSKVLLGFFMHGSLIYGASRGFLMTLRSPTDYPTNAEVIQMRHCPERLVL